MKPSKHASLIPQLLSEEDDPQKKKLRKRERDLLRRQALEEKKERRRIKDRERRLKQKMEREALKRAEEERILFQKRREDKAVAKGIDKQGGHEEASEERQRKSKINIEVQSLGLAYNRPRRKIKKPSYF